jgi:hypothetical protein
VCGGEEKCIEIIGLGVVRQHLEDLDIDGRLRGRLIWLNTCGGLVWRRGFFFF